MSTQENKAIVRQLFETMWQTGDLSPMDAHPGLREIIPNLQRTMDAHIYTSPTIMEICGEGEWVTLRMLNELPQKGEYLGTSSSGGKLEIIQMFRMVDGIIVKQHSQAGRIE